MSIPWMAALQVARTLLPVVVDNAPELLKTIGRLRAPVPAEPPATIDPVVSALHEQIDAHQRTIEVQANTIEGLQTALRTTQRSLSLARSLLVAIALLSLATFAYFLVRA
ncbi:MAG: hypothetical protein GDA66_03075 [Nitrospira sp. CR1.2]|nr:hypothetical protein [Nitrospira sp. CR1.2]